MDGMTRLQDVTERFRVCGMREGAAIQDDANNLPESSGILDYDGGRHIGAHA